MQIIADMIVAVVNKPNDSNVIAQAKAQARALCEAFPLFGN